MIASVVKPDFKKIILIVFISFLIFSITDYFLELNENESIILIISCFLFAAFLISGIPSCPSISGRVISSKLIFYFIAPVAISIMVNTIDSVSIKEGQAVWFEGTIFELVALLILAALAEELLFRHFLYDYFIKILSLPVAFVTISILFMLIHLDSSMLMNFQYFSVSLALLMLRRVSNDVWLCFLSHLTANLAVIYFFG